MNTQRYCLGVEGNSDFFRRVADAQERCLSSVFAGAGWEHSPDYFEAIAALKQYPRVENFGFGGASVVALFIATCFAKKMFDELYDRTLKRPISDFLNTLLAKPIRPTDTPIEFRHIIYLEDLKTVIVIRALVDARNAAQIQVLLSEAHRVAGEYIQLHGVKAAVHCHKIERGQANVQPELFESLEHMRQQDRKKHATTSEKEI